MGRSHDPMADDAPPSPTAGRHIIMHPLYLPKLPPWFDLRVFYIRIGNCGVFTGGGGGGGCSVPYRLTVSHFPLSPDTVLEVNGRRSSIHSDRAACSVLRRDRLDKDSEEVTFVSTDSIRMTGSVRFEIFDGEEPLLVGVLENVENKKWSMRCQPARFLKGKQVAGPETPSPVIEVYVAGCFAGSPIILTKTLQLSSRKKSQKKLVLDSIPEYDPTEAKKEVSSMQVSDYNDYKTEKDVGIDYNSIYSRAEYIEEDEDGELSWFNAGVRVGVGIGLGICLGVGIGVGVLVRTYQATTRNFKRRLI